jgi:hypothetical protein
MKLYLYIILIFAYHIFIKQHFEYTYDYSGK